MLYQIRRDNQANANRAQYYCAMAIILEEMIVFWDFAKEFNIVLRALLRNRRSILPHNHTNSLVLVLRICECRGKIEQLRVGFGKCIVIVGL
jgi:hypothetical protein